MSDNLLQYDSAFLIRRYVNLLENLSLLIEQFGTANDIARCNEYNAICNILIKDLSLLENTLNDAQKEFIEIHIERFKSNVRYRNKRNSK